MRGEYRFFVRSYECGPEGCATLPTVCNYLQEAASLQAKALGFGKTDFELAGENISWVLTRLVVKMVRYPRWQEEVCVITFPRGGRHLVAWRDFELCDFSGARLGVASSEWMILDLASRKAVAIPETVRQAMVSTEIPLLGEMPFSRFRFPPNSIMPEATAVFPAQKAHLDLNGHVNNVHSIAWMLEPCTPASPREMEVVFRSEILAGEQVQVQCVQVGEETFHRVFAPNGQDHLVARTRK